MQVAVAVVEDDVNVPRLLRVAVWVALAHMSPSLTSHEDAYLVNGDECEGLRHAIDLLEIAGDGHGVKRLIQSNK